MTAICKESILLCLHQHCFFDSQPSFCAPSAWKHLRTTPMAHGMAKDRSRWCGRLPQPGRLVGSSIEKRHLTEALHNEGFTRKMLLQERLAPEVALLLSSGGVITEKAGFSMSTLTYGKMTVPTRRCSGRSRQHCCDGGDPRKKRPESSRTWPL